LKNKPFSTNNCSYRRPYSVTFAEDKLDSGDTAWMMISTAHWYC